jgi:hypothetical protein
MYVKLFWFIFYLTLAGSILSSCNSNGQREKNLIDGLEMIYEGEVYVMHSMIYANGKPWTTSNIFVIRGLGDTVWIFGTGYGDFGEPCEEICNDNNYYLGSEFSGTGPATEDVRPVDSVITQVFGISRDRVVLQFIAPHYHNDHINSEFIDAFYTVYQYPMKAGEKIWIHANDYTGALCDEPCCGTQPCPDKKNKYYGVPFKPQWKPAYREMFSAIGNKDDNCNEVIKSFHSALGNWEISKGLDVSEKGHTDGTINLNNRTLQLRIGGTKSKHQCALPEGWKFISVHGNVHD